MMNRLGVTTSAAAVVSRKPRRVSWRRRAYGAAMALVVVLSGAVVASPADGQESTADAEVRVVARKRASGRIEFGLQQRQGDSTWGDRQLPRVRFFPTTATVNNWLASSSLDLPVGEVRVVARKRASGRIEFGLQQRQGDGTWGDRQLPRVRFFPTTATVNNWLASSLLTLTAPQASDRYSAVSAGGGHSCGLRTDGTIECWGSNSYGEGDAPAGRFGAVSAGGGHSCGLRTDGTIECWGSNSYGEGDAPAGRFGAVSAGAWHSCGLRTDGTIECWGSNSYGEGDAPAGRFGAVSAGAWHSCGLRTDGTIECWGSNSYGEGDAPAGRFGAVSAGGAHACGLRTDGTIECWGDNFLGQTDVPAGRFGAVSAGGAHACGLRTDGTITCWGYTASREGDAPPAGRFGAVSAGAGHACGLRTDGTIECWFYRTPGGVG